jgi:hypothetical protein
MPAATVVAGRVDPHNEPRRLHEGAPAAPAAADTGHPVAVKADLLHGEALTDLGASITLR